MKPLILEFAEEPQTEMHDWTKITYSKLQNLSVTSDGQPAINVLSMATTTFTKSNGEQSDSDQDVKGMKSIMATSTETRNTKEVSDNDQDIRNLLVLAATKTLTERGREASDSDK